MSREHLITVRHVLVGFTIVVFYKNSPTPVIRYNTPEAQSAKVAAIQELRSGKPLTPERVNALPELERAYISWVLGDVVESLKGMHSNNPARSHWPPAGATLMRDISALNLRKERLAVLPARLSTCLGDWLEKASV